MKPASLLNPNSKVEQSDLTQSPDRKEVLPRSLPLVSPSALHFVQAHQPFPKGMGWRSLGFHRLG